MKKVLFPGSFDPLTNGHINVITQACYLFDEVIVAILENPLKAKPYLTIPERQLIIQKIYQNNPQVKVITSNLPSTDLALIYNCQALIRGIRNSTDFNYEFQLAQINREISHNQVNTICLFTENNTSHISSTIVKELFRLNKDITQYVPKEVEESMKLKKVYYETKNTR